MRRDIDQSSHRRIVADVPPSEDQSVRIYNTLLFVQREKRYRPVNASDDPADLVHDAWLHLFDGSTGFRSAQLTDDELQSDARRALSAVVAAQRNLADRRVKDLLDRSKEVLSEDRRFRFVRHPTKGADWSFSLQGKSIDERGSTLQRVDYQKAVSDLRVYWERGDGSHASRVLSRDGLSTLLYRLAEFSSVAVSGHVVRRCLHDLIHDWYLVEVPRPLDLAEVDRNAAPRSLLELWVQVAAARTSFTQGDLHLIHTLVSSGSQEEQAQQLGVTSRTLRNRRKELGDRVQAFADGFADAETALQILIDLAEGLPNNWVSGQKGELPTRPQG